MSSIKWLLVCMMVFVAVESNAKNFPVEIKYVGQNKDSRFSNTLQQALAEIIGFSTKNGLRLSKTEDFVTKVFVYETKERFDSMIKSSSGWTKNSEVPKSYVGVGENKVFHIVSWSAYQSVHPSET